MMSDFAKFDRPALLHLAYEAYDKFMEDHGMELPVPGDVGAMDEFVTIAKSLDKDGIVADEKAERILKHLASGSRAILSPMCAALGGIVGQEVLKACSGKFPPIKGFLYFDADETLPDDVLPSEEVSPSGSSRYDSQIAVFGKEMHKRILYQK